MKKEKTSVKIIIDGNLEKIAKARRFNGDELEIKTRTIGGDKYMPTNKVVEFFERRYPGREINLVENYNQQSLKSTNKILY
jgi:hypothetical protein